jgi:hypothetical protein
MTSRVLGKPPRIQSQLFAPEPKTEGFLKVEAYCLRLEALSRGTVKIQRVSITLLWMNNPG